MARKDPFLQGLGVKSWQPNRANLGSATSSNNTSSTGSGNLGSDNGGELSPSSISTTLTFKKGTGHKMNMTAGVMRSAKSFGENIGKSSKTPSGNIKQGEVKSLRNIASARNNGTEGFKNDPYTGMWGDAITLSYTDSKKASDSYKKRRESLREWKKNNK